MNLQDLFNPRPPLRTAEQWKEILRWAVKELEDHLGVPGRITDFNVWDDKAEEKSHDNGVDVLFETQSQLGYDLCGFVGCLVNVGEAVWISADFLAFARGIRVPQYRDQHLIYRFDPKSSEQNKWSCTGWMVDGDGEWESYRDNTRWRKK